ncbi:ammonia-forming cytochrome c nitrite reductase [Pseudodesulfovibrio sp. zrk46]|uniref:ammonia-forming cytochrome c nitrite reductase n=1 Tax=Pseudodesulfovibrio sp. zrk46 TaxID=2725288 RepID=UPI001449EC93|nr:ammonia-forming cytochrome c nitrite reductase [Pseudodesulfovibrio sp. zrk46]QJB55283.1 ammonia-forming cytochrome c nitrite reductase [Pseudodesulfovibrio sp. zrk46]
MKNSLILAIAVAGIAFMTFMLLSIGEKKQEQALINTAPVVKAEGIEARSDEWAKYYPHQYDTWKQTSESSEIEDMVEKYPQLAILWAGYGFAKDYNAPRGHIFALQSNRNTLRTGAPTGPNDGPMPMACWTCKSSDVPRLMAEEGENEYFTGKWARAGSEIVNPIGCADCHNTQTSQLELSRPYLKRALEASGRELDKLTYQDMRSLACAQCHSEYYFLKTPYTDKNGKEAVAAVVTFPWAKGLSAEAMESYYNGYEFKDWTHKLSKTPMLKAQHPGYEIFTTGIHFKRGLACADCHMPYTQKGAIKFSTHKIQNPLNDIANSCLTCHRQSEEEFKQIVKEKLDRKNQLNVLTMNSIASAHLEAKKAWELGATDAEMTPVIDTIRSAQWIWDYSIASHGSFFHAPGETLRLLAVANDKSQHARLALAGILAKYGVINYQVPDFSTKEKAQQLAGVPLQKLVDDKLAFKKGLMKNWLDDAVKDGRLTDKFVQSIPDKASYPQ